uniref:Putative capsid n=1 Tax=Arivirus 2 TaxID=1552987 RepID=A0A097BW43_9VIRU|nr:putative capsid [Arivirus 2]
METTQLQQQPTTHENAHPADSDIHSHLDITHISEITKFEDEVPTQRAVVPSQPHIPETHDPFPDQALADFLQRPRVVHSFKWLSSSASGTCLARLSFPDALFSCPTVWNKVQQFVYLHAGLHFTVRANGTPFHYGQLLVVWRPACLQRTVFTATRDPGIYDNLYTLTQYPHMLISPSSAQVVEMDVPYESPLDHVVIRSFSEQITNNHLRAYSSLGFIEFWVLTPLRGQGAANTEPPVTVSLFAHFTNPSLSGFTHAQFAYHNQIYQTPNAPPMPTALRFPVQIAQAGEDNFPRVATDKKRIKNPEQLPVVFLPAKTSSTENHQPTYVLSLNERSQSSYNKKKITKISDHLHIWSLFQQYTVTTTSELNSVIASFYVHPANCPTGKYKNTNVSFNTKLSYISYMFALWRGPIEYRFDFIASKFHSCRIKIAWYPPKTTELATNDELPDAWTQIVDVQGQTSATFTVPWIQATSWLTFDRVGAYRSANGIIVITLLNSLSYPTLNGPPVSINCWVRAPNIELAGFTAQNSVPTYMFTGTNFRDIPETGMFSLSAPPAQPAPKAVSHEQSQEVTSTTQVAQAGQLYSQINPVDLDSLPQKPTFLAFLTPRGKIYITPPLPEPLAPSVNQTRSVRMNTLLDYLSPLHLGFIGSTRIAALDPALEVLYVPRISRGSAIEHTFKSSTDVTSRIINNRFSASSYFPSSVNSIKDVTLPNYSSLLYRPTLIEPYNIDASASLTLPGIDVYSLSNTASLLTLAGADDFEFIGMAPAPLTW